MNMRKTFFHIVAVAILGLTSAVALNARTSNDDDEYKTKTFDVGTVTSVDANGLFRVIYEQTSGDTEVSVKTKDKVFEYLEVKNDDGMLVLKLNLKEGKSYSLSPIEVKVRTKHLTYVELSGSGSFTCENGIKTESLKIRSSGAGSVEIKELSAKSSIEIMTSGAGKVNLDGAKSKDLSVEMNGAGKVEVQGIESQTTTAIIRGAGKITLGGKTGNATYKLNGVGVIDAESLKADNVRSDRAGIGSIRY
ncbi:MAG TPA: hypothetical protein DDX40_01895 [Rikenellaceae bacterium]|nr:hypothetical protein [Rikenellaceae bacterium]